MKVNIIHPCECTLHTSHLPLPPADYTASTWILSLLFYPPSCQPIMSPCLDVAAPPQHYTKIARTIGALLFLLLTSLLLLQPALAEAPTGGGEEDYDGFILVRVVPRTPEHQETLLNLNRDFAGSEHIDFWKHGRRLSEPVEILVSRVLRDQVLGHLRQKGMSPKVKIADMKRAM